MAMLNLVAPQFRTQWETFTVQNEYATGFLVNTGIAIFSTDMLATLQGFKSWSGVRYIDEDNNVRIGYGPGDPDLEQGMTESEAYAELIADLRNKQRIVRAQLPIFAIPQSVFDALVSLYADTGTWRVVQAEEGTYNLADAIRNSNWLLAADMLMRGVENSDLRKTEARALYLGDYPVRKDRNKLIVDGLQTMRINYVAGAYDGMQTKQAEFSYFKQVGAFLPTMSEARQRRVVAQSTTRTDGRNIRSPYVDPWGGNEELPPDIPPLV